MIKYITSIIAAGAVAGAVGGGVVATSTYYKETRTVEIADVYADEAVRNVARKLDRYLDIQIARLDEEQTERAKYQKFLDGGANVKTAPWTKR